MKDCFKGALSLYGQHQLETYWIYNPLEFSFVQVNLTMDLYSYHKRTPLLITIGFFVLIYILQYGVILQDKYIINCTCPFLNTTLMGLCLVMRVTCFFSDHFCDQSSKLPNMCNSKF